MENVVVFLYSRMCDKRFCTSIGLGMPVPKGVSSICSCVGHFRSLLQVYAEFFRMNEDRFRRCQVYIILLGYGKSEVHWHDPGRYELDDKLYHNRLQPDTTLAYKLAPYGIQAPLPHKNWAHRAP